MLTVHNLSKTFDLDPLFENVTFSVNSGERIGLIGPNGSGKTTILRMIAGHEPLPKGAHIAHANGLRIGYLTQGFELDSAETIANILDAAVGNIDQLEAELGELAMALVNRPNDDDLQARYDTVLQQLSAVNPDAARPILTALGLDNVDAHLPVSTLSGGQKTRLMLALILLNEPELLLLDEPTNHLDIGMLEWLEQWLSRFSGGVLMVSHDRTFLDRTVTKILDLDVHTRRVQEYAGNYSDYLDQYRAAREKQWSTYKDQQYEVRRMKQDIARTREQSDKVHRETTPGSPNVRRLAKKVMKKALSREKKLDRYVESDERVEKPSRSWQMNLDFGEQGHIGRKVLSLHELSVGYSAESPLLTNISLNIQSGQRIVLTGENGSGKTTLMRTIAGQLPPLAGTFNIGGSAKMGYMSQEQELLNLDHSPTETMLHAKFGNETDARNFLHNFLFTGDEALKPARQLSFGQRARLSLALLVAQGCNFLMLDEPINHLDIPSRTMFEQALTGFPGTVFAVVHDRYFIERFATHIWWVEDGGVRQEIRD